MSSVTLSKRSVLLSACILLSLACSLTTNALDIGHLSLKDCVLLGMRNNPDLINSELDRVTQKYTLALAYDAFSPQFSLSGATSYGQSKAGGLASSSHSLSVTPEASLKTAYGTTFKATVTNSYDHHYTPGLSFEVTQPLLQGFGPDIAASDLYQAIEAEKINRMSLRDDVISTVGIIVRAYRQVIADKLSLASQKQQLQSSLTELHNTELKIKAGTIAPATRIQAQATIAQQKLDLINSQNLLAQNKRALLALIGLTTTTTYSIDRDISIPKYRLPSLPQAIKRALAFDTTYQTALISRAVNNRTLLQAEDAKRWQLDLTAKTSHGGNVAGESGFAGVFNGYDHSQEVDLDLTIPLDRLQLDSAIVAAKIAIQKNEISIQQQKRAVETKVTDAYHDIINNRASLELAKQAVKLQQTVLQQTVKQANLGRKSQFEVNTERQTLLRVQQSYITAKLSYVNDITNFESIIGTTLKTWHIKVNY